MCIPVNLLSPATWYPMIPRRRASRSCAGRNNCDFLSGRLRSSENTVFPLRISIGVAAGTLLPATSPVVETVVILACARARTRNFLFHAKQTARTRATTDASYDRPAK